MYTIHALVDGIEYPLHDLSSSQLVTGDAWFEVGDNVNGSAGFTIYPDHPYYDKVVKLATDIIFRKDGDAVFYGRVLFDDEDLSGTKKVTVEGEMAFFCDSIQRPAVYHNISVLNYLRALVNNHNSQVEARKRFTVGRVSVTDGNDSLYRYSNWETTRELLQDRLVDRLGGHLVIRRESGVRYLDYLSDSDYYSLASQTIEFGKNLLSYSKNITAADITTCLIPLGDYLPEEEQDPDLQQQRVTIESVNGGVDYITDANAAAMYGKIYRTEIWEDVTQPANLLTKAQAFLTTVQWEKMILEVHAVDLNLADSSIDEFRMGHRVRCISPQNGMDVLMPIRKIRIYLTDFSKNTFTLGGTTKHMTYTSANQSKATAIQNTVKNMPSSILNQARETATALINAATTGYVVTRANEILIMDTPDIDTATNVWRWNQNGLGYSSNGYEGPYNLAMTSNGEIVADFITTGTLNADRIRAGVLQDTQGSVTWDLATGIMTFLVPMIINSANFKLNAAGQLKTTGAVISRGGDSTGGYWVTALARGGVYGFSGDKDTIESGDYQNALFTIMPQLDASTGDWTTIFIGKKGLSLLGNGGGVGVGSTDIFSLGKVNSGSGSTLVLNSSRQVCKSSSSARYKDIFAELTAEDVEDLYNIEVRHAKYKDGYLEDDDPWNGKTMPMLIAENVEEHLPEAVVYDADGQVEDWNYRVLIPAMLQMIKSQKVEIEELKQAMKKGGR